VQWFYFKLTGLPIFDGLGVCEKSLEDRQSLNQIGPST
jgi:hypothetical protein